LKRGFTGRIVLVLIAVCSTAATALAMRRTSTTFDEIVLIAGGARGFELGKFDLAPEHPPVMQYLYGLPAYLTKPNYPPERVIPGGYSSQRYMYAQEFFWLSGNDAERLAFAGRLMAALCVLGLVLLTYAFTARASSPTTARMYWRTAVSPTTTCRWHSRSSPLYGHWTLPCADQRSAMA
jgi:hypothetical protein